MVWTPIRNGTFILRIPAHFLGVQKWFILLCGWSRWEQPWDLTVGKHKTTGNSKHCVHCKVECSIKLFFNRNDNTEVASMVFFFAQFHLLHLLTLVNFPSSLLAPNTERRIMTTMDVCKCPVIVAIIQLSADIQPLAHWLISLKTQYSFSLWKAKRNQGSFCRR